MSRTRLAHLALVLAALWTAACGALLLLRAVGEITLRGAVADVLQFVLAMGYVGLVPVASVVAFFAGERSRPRRALAAVLLVLWAGTLAWAATLHF